MNTIAVDDIVNIVEDGVVAITLSGVDADVVTTTVQVTAASNIDATTGLPIDTNALVAATGSGDSWTVDTTRLVPTVTMWCRLGRWTMRVILPARAVPSSLTPRHHPSGGHMLF